LPVPPIRSCASLNLCREERLLWMVRPEAGSVEHPKNDDCIDTPIHGVYDEVGSATYRQLPGARYSSCSAEVRIVSESGCLATYGGLGVKTSERL
jgi:hypothetical protein